MRRILLLTALSLPLTLCAQESLQITVNPEKTRKPRISSEHLGPGQLKVIVIDSAGPVGGLTVNDLQVRSALSDFELQDVQQMLQTENAKASLVLCIDNSNSMKKHVGILKRTLDELLGSLAPSVKVGPVFFQEGFRGNNTAGVLPVENIRIYGLTRDKDEVRRRSEMHLERSRLSSRTYLYDEVYASIALSEQVADPEEQRYVIVLSDGLDNSSTFKKEDVRRRASQNPNLVFFTIDYLTKANPFLVELSSTSGGRHFRARKSEELSSIFEDISKDIVKLSGYLVNYTVPMAYLAGRVVSKQNCQAPANSRIEYLPLQFETKRDAATVRDDGLFHTRVAFPHRWRLVASAPGYISDSLEVEVPDRDLYFADFALSPAYIELVGRLMDSGTAPLADARVIVTELESGEVLFDGVTDSLGAYRIKSPVGKPLLVTATKSGYTFGTIELSDVNDASQLGDIVLGLTSEGFVSEFRFLFEFNSDRLDMADLSTETQLKGCTDFIIRELLKSQTRMVRLVGWTDNVGDADYNQQLALRRAEYVKAALVKQDISADRIIAEGHGISEKYDNETDEGRAFNRRTDIVFFDQDEAVSSKQ